MLQLVFSPSAISDIDSIYEWIEIDSLTAAHRVVDRIRDECLFLRSSPFVGHLRPEAFIPEGTRTVRAYSYLIFYRVHEDVVHIGRVIHGAQDLGPDLFEGANF